MKEQENESQFDADLIAILNGEMRGSPYMEVDPNTIFIDRRTGTETPVQLQMFWDLSHVKGIKHDYPESIKRSMERTYEKSRRRLERLVGKRITRTILEGRIHLSMLVNTPGGLQYYPLECSAEHFSENGHVDAYITQYAMSAGAHAIEKAKSRYALADAHMMWHLPDPKMDPEPIDDLDDGDDGSANDYDYDLIAGGTQRIEDFLVRSSRPKKRAEMAELYRRVKEDPSNRLNEITFTGKELRAFGIIRKTYERVSELMDDFMEGVKMHPDALVNVDHPVHGFFRDSLYTGLLIKETGVLAHVHGEGRQMGIRTPGSCTPAEVDQVSAALVENYEVWHKRVYGTLYARHALLSFFRGGF